MSKNIIISLFDFSGSWSKPYRDAGFYIIQIDVKNGIDVMKWDYEKIDKTKVKGILAAPPCTHFTRASQHLWAKYDSEGKTDHSVELVEKTLEIIDYFEPDFWAIENPPGRIEKLIPELKKFRLLNFQPFHYGDPYSKYTILYGQFNPFLIQNFVKKEYVIKDIKGTKPVQEYYKSKYAGLDRAALRSITPEGFSYAFFRVNCT